MRRRAIWFLALVAISVALWLPVLASPVQQQTLVQISSPGINDEVRGTVPIIGSASVPSFQFYKVEFGVGPNPSNWALIDRMYETPVINGQLLAWNTAAVPDGVYSLRLHAVKQDGNYEEFFVRGVVVANAGPIPTPTEEPTPTPEGPATPVGPTPPAEVPGEPRPTATVEILAPAAPLQQPTPTPTLSRPIAQRESAQLDPQGWTQSFVFGAAAMGAVLVMLGIVFGVRRLL
jgi:hypothetical protein